MQRLVDERVLDQIDRGEIEQGRDLGWQSGSQANPVNPVNPVDTASEWSELTFSSEHQFSQSCARRTTINENGRRRMQIGECAASRRDLRYIFKSVAQSAPSLAIAGLSLQSK